MSKEGSDSLYRLIQSLTRVEKRYVSVFLQRQAGNRKDIYNKLFDTLNKQTAYDEQKLSDFPHLPVMKIRLEDHILNCLLDYHAERSVAAKLKSNIRAIEILFYKGLFDHALRQIVRAKKTAEHNEEYLSLHELLKWELRIVNAQAFANVSAADLKKLYKQAEECLDKVNNANQYGLFSDVIYLQIRKHGFFRKKEELKKFARIMQHPLLRSIDKAQSMDAKYYYHSSHIGIAQLEGKYDKAFKNNNEVLKLLESNPQHIQKDPRKYLTMQQNATVWQYHFKEYRKASEAMEKLKQFTLQQRAVISEYMFSRTMYYANTSILACYSRMGEYEKGLKLAEQFIGEFSKYNVTPPNREAEWMFCDAAATIYFGAGKYSESIRWLNKIIQDKEGNIRSDIQCMTRILSLIAHYELGNQELLRYMVKWTYRFMAKRQRLYKFETIILNFIGKKSLHMDTKGKTVAAFSELKNELVKLLPDMHERRPLDDFEYIDWLDSKIQNKPFAETVRKKFI